MEEKEIVNIEVHSQHGSKKLKQYLAKLPFAKGIDVTDVPDACTGVLIGKDKPFLRVYWTTDDPLSEILDALKHFAAIYQLRIEITQPLLEFIEPNPAYDGHLPQ